MNIFHPLKNLCITVSTIKIIQGKYITQVMEQEIMLGPSSVSPDIPLHVR